jgi:hypothetical protein
MGDGSANAVKHRACGGLTSPMFENFISTSESA